MRTTRQERRFSNSISFSWLIECNVARSERSCGCSALWNTFPLSSVKRATKNLLAKTFLPFSHQRARQNVCVCVCVAPRPSSDTCSFKLLCRNVSILCTPVFSVHVSYIFNLKTSMHCLPLPELPWRKQGVRFLRKIKKEIMYLCIFQSWAHMSLACCCVLLLIKRCDFLSACLTVLWMSVYSILSVTQHTHTHTHTHMKMLHGLVPFLYP